MACTWNNAERTEILLTKEDGTTLILKVGSCITYKGRELGVLLESIIGTSVGPLGFEYLPWKGDRWAGYSFSISKGNERRLVCRPTGTDRYTWGEIPDWNTVQLIDNPDS